MDRLLANSRVWAGISALLLLSVTTAQAQQPSQAQRDAVRQSCRSDFIANCSGDTPGGKDALDCLKRNLTNLSSACQAAVSALSPPAAAPQSQRPAQQQPRHQQQPHRPAPRRQRRSRRQAPRPLGPSHPHRQHRHRLRHNCPHPRLHQRRPRSVQMFWCCHRAKRCGLSASVRTTNAHFVPVCRSAAAGSSPA